MPLSAPRPCCHPGCKAYAGRRGYCEQHQKDRRTYDDRRGTSTERGYGVEWRRARALYLRAHPYCVECDRHQQLTPATVVDHIVPHKGDNALFWDEGNWQALCGPCHSRKTITEDMGSWRDTGQSRQGA